MLTLILSVFGTCFLGITLLVVIYCVLFGGKSDLDDIDEQLKMKRFLIKYQNHVEGKKDDSGIIYK